jgi:nitrogen-specific signal transduction histidine kinase
MKEIAERKRAEDHLRRVEQVKLVGGWALWLAQEIRNPLAGIKASIKVSKRFDENTLTLTADPLQLREVFLNLLFNAIEAMPAAFLCRYNPGSSTSGILHACPSSWL